jgi:hypothetical protein
VGVVLVVLVAALGPWCYRNYEISGRPFGIAGFAAVEGTTYFPGNRLQRSMPENLAADLNRVTLGQYFKKLMVGGSAAVRDEIPKLGGSWVSALFLVGLLAPFRHPGLGRLRYFLGGALLLFIVVQSVGRTQAAEVSPEVHSENFLVLLFGIALFYSFMDQVPFELPALRAGAIAGFVALVSLPLALAFLPPRTYPNAYPPYHPPSVKAVADWIRDEERELMMSDMPWAVAWYGNRACLWVTLDTGLASPSDFFAIHDYMKPIKLLYLTPISLDVKFVGEMLKGNEAAWSRFALDSMVRTNVPPGFPLKHSPRGYLPDFLILTDRKRW